MEFYSKKDEWSDVALPQGVQNLSESSRRDVSCEFHVCRKGLKFIVVLFYRNQFMLLGFNTAASRLTFIALQKNDTHTHGIIQLPPVVIYETHI